MSRSNRTLLLLIILAASLVASAKSFTFASGASRPPGVLRWAKREIPVSISESLFSSTANIKYGSDVVGAIDRSFTAWAEATGLEFTLIRTANLRANPSGNSGDGVNLITIAPLAENILLLGRDADIAAGATRIFYDHRGRITEADIVLSPLQQFSTDGTFGTFDLESALMHEIGHLLGLDHSPIPAATMFDNYWRNGILGLVRTAARSLSGDDIAAARALYGTGESSICCGKLTGTAFVENGEPASGILIWLEDAETGQLVASGITNSRGRFAIAGLQIGRVRVFAGRVGEGFAWVSIGSLPAAFVGEFTISKNTSTKLSVFVPAVDETMSGPVFAGLNGEFSTLPLPITAGRITTIYLVGQEFTRDGIKLEFGSPFIHALPDSVFDVQYENGMTAVGVSIAVDVEIPEGDYSIFVEMNRRVKSYLPGMLTVD